MNEVRQEWTILLTGLHKFHAIKRCRDFKLNNKLLCSFYGNIRFFLQI